MLVHKKDKYVDMKIAHAMFAIIDSKVRLLFTSNIKISPNNVLHVFKYIYIDVLFLDFPKTSSMIFYYFSYRSLESMQPELQISLL